MYIYIYVRERERQCERVSHTFDAFLAHLVKPIALCAVCRQDLLESALTRTKTRSTTPLILRLKQVLRSSLNLMMGHSFGISLVYVLFW